MFKIKQTWLLVLSWVAYVVAATMLGLSRRGPMPTVFDFEYGFGDLVGSLLQRHVYASADGLFTAHRMPLIPYFLTAISLVSTNGLFVHLAKNLLVFSLSGLAFWAIAAKGRSVNRKQLIFLAACLFLSPRFILYGTMPDVEEGYLIHFLAILFAGLFFFDELDLQHRPGFLIVLAFFNAALFLTKSSMLLSSTVLCAAYVLRSGRDRRVAVPFTSAIAGSLLLWGAMNTAHSGRFTLSSSIDGWNFYKGNNELTAELYPPYNLDILDQDGRLAVLVSSKGEWVVDQEARGQAITFIVTHPLDALRLLARRCFVFFVEVRRTPIWVGERQVSSFFDWIAIVFMAAFRLLFYAMVAVAVRSLVRGRCLSAREPHPLALNAGAFLTFIIAYAAPYLAGFAYERHVMPLMVPTAFFFLSWTSAKMKWTNKTQAG